MPGASLENVESRRDVVGVEIGTRGAIPHQGYIVAQRPGRAALLLL
jgi:hypothetical protein